MSTISDIAIKFDDPLDIVKVIEQTYVIGERIVKDHSNLFEFILKVNKNQELEASESYLGSRTFVIHQERNQGWTQIDYELENIYEFDELLKRLTLEFSTKALIGYNQTTSGDFRFALFEEGELKRSIFQKYISSDDHIRLMDNYGVKLSFETINFGTPFTKELPRVQILDYEVFNVWYKELGFIYEEREGLEYLHLEIKNFKN